MNLLQRVVNYFDKRSLTSSQLFELIAAGNSTYSGVSVTEDNAMRSSAVYACIRIISESIASLPLVLYRQQGRNKNRATDHPTYSVLHNLANPLMTALEWRELTMAHALLRGNAWSQKTLNFRGQTVELWPLNPAMMEGYERRDNQFYWLYRNPDNELQALNSQIIHHVKGLGDGYMGRSPIQQAAKQAVGLSLAAEESGARLFSNGARPGLILRHPGKLSDGAAKRLKESFVSEHQGLSNAHKTKILEEGMDVSTIGFTPEEAQFLETRKFQVTEIARIYRVPPHMLADLDRATFSNIEQQSLNFVIYTLMPWLVRHEQAIYRDLLSVEERKTIFAKYIVEGMLRGDTLSRYQAHQIGINNTILTPNEARELEDRNPIEGGDKLFVPLNMMELGATPPTPAPAQGSQPTQAARWSDQSSYETRADKAGNDRRALMNRNVRLFEEAVSRVVKREATDIRKAAKSKLGKRSAESFETWLEGFYKQLRTWFPDYFRNIMLTYAESIMASVASELGNEPVELDDDLRKWVDGYLANYVEVYAVGGEKQLRALLAESEGDEDAEAKINERMDGWESTKAGKEGFEQAFEAGNALAIFGYAAGGVSLLQWRATGESCPLCRKMNGKRIKIGGAFFEAGDKHEAEGVDPLPIVRKIKHGPLHSGCLTGDSLVLSSHKILAASKRWFDGDVVVIQTANGHKLTCTPNHPILTRGGWVAAGLLNIGDSVISDSGSERRDIVDGNNQNVPTRIEDVVKAFGSLAEVVACPVPVTAENFHGDGKGSEVAIIWANRLLLDGFDTSLEQHSAECPFVSGDVATALLSGFSRKALFSEGLFTSSGSDVSGSGLGLTFSVSHLTSANQSGMTVAAGSNAVLDQPSSDNISGHVEFERQGIFGLPAEIITDEIVDVQRVDFSGHVYNLQTETGWYVAESIITHNCDCTVVAG